MNCLSVSWILAVVWQCRVYVPVFKSRPSFPLLRPFSVTWPSPAPSPTPSPSSLTPRPSCGCRGRVTATLSQSVCLSGRGTPTGSCCSPPWPTAGSRSGWRTGKWPFIWTWRRRRTCTSTSLQVRDCWFTVVFYSKAWGTGSGQRLVSLCNNRKEGTGWGYKIISKKKSQTIGLSLFIGRSTANTIFHMKRKKDTVKKLFTV